MQTVSHTEIQKVEPESSGKPVVGGCVSWRRVRKRKGRPRDLGSKILETFNENHNRESAEGYRASFWIHTKLEASKISQETMRRSHDHCHRLKMMTNNMDKHKQMEQAQNDLSQLQNCTNFHLKSRKISKSSTQFGIIQNLVNKTSHLGAILNLLTCVLMLISASLMQSTQAQAFADQSQLQMESRAEQAPNLAPHLKPPQGLAFNQLVNLLNSINGQQSPISNNNNNIMAQNQRRSPSPLPLGALGSRGIQQQTGSSTPVNPFLAAAQFQPTRRIPSNNNYNNNPSGINNQQPFASTSPPTLTLNRIPNLMVPANNIHGPLRGFNGANNNQMQLTNAVPIGSSIASNNRGMQTQLANNVRFTGQNQPPTRIGGQQSTLGARPSLSASSNSVNHPSTLVPLPPQLQVPLGSQQQVRPISGFAPSGPPPSSMVNNAINVIQSPSNAIGYPNGAATTLLPPMIQVSSSSSSSNRATNNIDSTRGQADSTEPSVPITSRPMGQVGSSTTSDSTTTTATTTVTSGSNSSQITTIADANTTRNLPPNAHQDPSSSTAPPPVASGPSWSPVGDGSSLSIASDNISANRNQTQRPSILAPSPDIVTVPPGYNPDNPTPPDNYDISVSAQMSGGQLSSNKVIANTMATPSVDFSLTTGPSSSSVLIAESPLQSVLSSGSPWDQPTIVAPTEITTIFWSPPPQSSIDQANILMSEKPTHAKFSTPTVSADIQPTRVVSSLSMQTTDPTTSKTSPSSSSSSSSTTTTTTTTTTTATSATISANELPASRIRDNSLQNDEPTTSAPTSSSSDEAATVAVVYGKRPSSGATEPRPSGPQGRPFIQTAQLDNQVRPYAGSAQQHQQGSMLRSTSGHHGSHFKPSKQINGAPSSSSSNGLHVGSGFSIVAANGNQTMPTGDIQDYVANQPPPFSTSARGHDTQPDHEPTISAQGGPDPLASSGSDQMAAQDSNSSPQHKDPSQEPSGAGPALVAPSQTGASPATRPHKRPVFKPKPAIPPIRIDSCIVGDDSSCDQSHNERCITEYGISSCHCKPGFARLSQLRGYCSPISLYQFEFKIDKLSDNRRLVYNYSLENSNSEEYQYLEFETIQALVNLIQQTSLAKQFMGARLNKFLERDGKVWANLSINLEENNLTRSDKIPKLAQQELVKLQQLRRRQPIGDTTIVLDGTKESISKLVDVNECANKDLNDCSKHATCINVFGGFQCQCLSGYEDKHLQHNQQQQQEQQQPMDKNKLGRTCLGCSASFCSNRGDCFIADGRKQCKCRPNFMGARCDIDTEVLAVAIGGSLVGIAILIVTFWCLYAYNRKWRREQQKMDAMSATSGLTYNYVNSSSSSNSLMTPASRTIAPGPMGRSGPGPYVTGQRLGRSMRNHSHYTDQQAIMGSASSGSSAASQPLACNPYAPNYHYEDAGLLIAPASTGSSEQTSPSSNSYRGIMGNHHAGALAMHAAGNAYTLSGHHHHLNHHHQPHQHHHSAHQQHQHLMHNTNHQHQMNHTHGKPLTQFHPAAEYRTLNSTNQLMQPPQATTTTTNGYDARWRTLQQDSVSKQSGLVGYYLVR